jgi:hypothetical protein
VSKETVSITVDRAVLAAADADARAAGVSRSELIERALRREHLRVALLTYRSRTIEQLGIDEYAATVYTVNRGSGL